MSFVHYTLFEEDSEEEQYSSFVNIEEFEDETPEGFDRADNGSEINPVSEERNNIRPWDPSEIFFCII